MKKLLVALALTLTGVSHAQSSKAGYIVTKAGDTTQGFFSGGQNFFEPLDSIQFKTTNETVYVTYTAKDIAAAYNGSILLRATEVSYNQDAIDDIDGFYSPYYEIWDSIVTKSHFLEVTVEGYYSFLLLHISSSTPLFYLQNPDGTTIPLYDTKEISEQNTNKFAHRREFSSALYVATMGCDELQKRLVNVHLNQHSLEKYIININKCLDKPFRVIKPKAKISSGFGVRASGTISWLTLLGYRYELDMPTNPGMGYSLGVTYLVQKERWIPRYKIRFDLDYTQRASTSSVYYYSLFDKGDFNFTYDPAFLQLSLGPSLNLGSNSGFKLYPFISGGILMSGLESFRVVTFDDNLEYLFPDDAAPYLVSVGMELGYDIFKTKETSIGVFTKIEAGILCDGINVKYTFLTASAGLGYYF